MSKPRRKSIDFPRRKSNEYLDPLTTPTSVDGQQNNESQGGVADMKKDPFQSIVSMPDDLRMADDSLIAVAGSNGVVVVWRTCDILGGGFGDDWNRGGGNIFGGDGGTNNKNDLSRDQFLQQLMNLQGREGGGNRRANSSVSSPTIGQPEAILVEHNRAVNCIAWHRHRTGVFLTASQDGTVKMFERRETKSDKNDEIRTSDKYKWKWFAKSTSSSSVKSYSWHYTGCFKPNCGPVRDIQWSHCNDDLFAMVTNNGFLVVHNVKLVNNGRPMVRIAAHAREATTLDWHPIEPYVIATGSVDRTVKGNIVEMLMISLRFESPTVSSFSFLS